MLPAVSWRPGPEPARAWLEQELAHAEYHRQPVWQRLLDWLAGLWHGASESASHAGGLSTPVAIAVAVLLAMCLIVAVSRLTRTPVAAERHPVLSPSTRESAAAHRARAEAALAAGDPDTAVLEATRALARRMADRGVLDDLPGRTAVEIAVALGAAFPAARTRLGDAAAAFDGVAYGNFAATRGQAVDLLRLANDLHDAAPSRSTGSRLHAAVPQ